MRRLFRDTSRQAPDGDVSHVTLLTRAAAGFMQIASRNRTVCASHRRDTPSSRCEAA